MQLQIRSLLHFAQSYFVKFRPSQSHFAGPQRQRQKCADD